MEADAEQLNADSPFLEVGADVVIASVVWEVASAEWEGARCFQLCFEDFLAVADANAALVAEWEVANALIVWACFLVDDNYDKAVEG
jgi:hypothetical protein